MNPVTTPSVIVDASVAAKWCLPAQNESHVLEANRLFRDFEANRVHFAVPGFFWVEVANVFWKAVRTQRWSLASASTSILWLKDLNIVTFTTQSLCAEALSIAAATSRTVYDSLYVALAIETGSILVTADEKLVNALPRKYPVQWLANY